MAKPRKKKSESDQAIEAFGGEIPKNDSPAWSSKYVEAAGQIDGWEQANKVFDAVTSVRTVFPDFNRAVRTGGLPVRRIHTVHGPTHGGKTAFVLGLVKSFVDPGYLAGYVDAEHALGEEFVTEMVRDLESKPNFQAVRPESYEKTIASVDAFLKTAENVKKKHPESKAVMVIDSINKLVPERELEKFTKGGSIDHKGANEMAKAHHGRYRAALNQMWLDQLTPKLTRSDCAMIIIAQERDKQDTTSFFKDDFEVKGGAALLFDASLVMRVMKSSPTFGSGSDKSNENIVGHSHRVRIWKSKVGHMQGRYTDCKFHLSNGVLTPEGLDTARDAVNVGIALGIVKQTGAWYQYNRKKKQGENAIVKHFSERPMELNHLLGDIANKLDQVEGRV